MLIQYWNVTDTQTHVDGTYRA